jgi:hypothetical protein
MGGEIKRVSTRGVNSPFQMKDVLAVLRIASLGLLVHKTVSFQNIQEMRRLQHLTDWRIASML